MDSRHRAMILAAAVISVAILSLGGGSFGSDATDPTQDYSEVSTGQDITSATDAPTTLIVGDTYVIEGGYWMTSDTGVLTACQENEGWNVHYDTSINTLTLKEANISGAVSEPTMSLSVGIFASNVFEAVALTIQLEGTNTVTSDGLGIWTYSTGGAVALTISGKGSLNASCSSFGILVQSNSGDAALTIRDADVNASVTSASGDGVEIRAGENSGATLTVDDGSLVAQGASDSGSSICFLFGSTYSSGETPAVTVSGSALVDAREGGIASNSSQDPSVTTGNGEGGGGIIFDGDQGTVYGNVTLQEDLTVDDDETLVVGEGSSLTIPEGRTLMIEGSVDGKLSNGGSIWVGTSGSLSGKVEGNQPIYASTVTVTISGNNVTGSGGSYEARYGTTVTITATITASNAGTLAAADGTVDFWQGDVGSGVNLGTSKIQVSEDNRVYTASLEVKLENTDNMVWNPSTYTITAHFSGVTVDSYSLDESTGTAQMIIDRAIQSAPAQGEGYTIDYEDETITIWDGYEVFTGQGTGTQIQSGIISNYIDSTLYIRKAQTSTHDASGWTELAIPARPALNSLFIDYEDEGVVIPAGCCYSFTFLAAEMPGWEQGTGALVEVEPGGTIHIYQGATDTAFRSNVLTLSAPSRASTPDLPTIDYEDETLSTLGSMQYRVGNDGAWKACTSDMQLSVLGWNGSAMQVYFRTAAGDGSYASEPTVALEIPARPSAPVVTGIAVTDTSVTLPYDDGWEYSEDGQNWQSGEGKNVFTGLTQATPYTYYVRVSHTDGSFASEPVTVSVSVITGAEATVGDDTITVTGVGPEGNITIPEEYSDYDLVIEKGAIEELAEAGSGITIERKGGITVSYDPDAVSGMLEAANDDGVRFEASRDGHMLTISVTVSVYDSSGTLAYMKEIHDFGGTATISFEYTLPDWLTPKTVAVYHMVGDRITEMMETWYDDGVLNFIVDHHSTYVIGEYIAPDPDPVYPPTWDDDDDYVPILPPSVTVNKDDGEDMAVAIVACAAVGVLAALMLTLVWTTRKR